MASGFGRSLTADAGLLSRSASSEIKGKRANLVVIDDRLSLIAPDKKAVRLTLKHNKVTAVDVNELVLKLRTLHSIGWLDGIVVSFEGQVGVGYNGGDLDYFINRVIGLFARTK